MSSASITLDKLELLQQTEMFASLGPEALRRLADGAKVVQASEGEHIIRRGDMAHCMYVLARGEVQVPVLDREGSLRCLSQFGPGQILGELALLIDEPRTADVIAVSDCVLLELQRSAFDELMSSHPTVARLMTHIVGERLLNGGVILQVGKYRVLDELGRGGMSIVFEGLHPELRRTVAIKMLSHELACSPGFVERFRGEARTIARLRHPNIVDVYDIEVAFATVFIIMERLEGRTLHELLRDQGPLSYAECRRVLVELARALQLTHSQDVVHRDIKAMNVFVSPTMTIKLMDFGVAVPPQTASLDGTMGVWGSHHYMAPELIRSEPFDGRADIYALGILAYEMLTGELPFRGEILDILRAQVRSPLPSLRERLPDIPEELLAFVLRATAKDPAERHRSCAEVLEQLAPASAQAHGEAVVRRISVSAPAGRRAQLDAYLAHCAALLAEFPDLSLIDGED